MTQELINEVEGLKNSLKATTAQLDASKGMLNEYIQGALSLRSNIILFQQMAQDSINSNTALTNEVAQLKSQVDALNSELNALKIAQSTIDPNVCAEQAAA